MLSRFHQTLLLIICVTMAACQDSLPDRASITPQKALGSGGTTTPTPTTDQTRPDGAISFKSDFCACKDNKAVSYGNCSSFCATKSTNGVVTFFANFNVTEAISLGGLGSVYGWCKTALTPKDGQQSTVPHCILEAKDDDGNVIPIDITPVANSNSITATLDEKKILDDRTYVFTLVESTSGARSDSIQIIKFSPDFPMPILGPLKNAPISQYSCILRQSATDNQTGDVYFQTATRIHFYFLPRIPPQPIPPGTPGFICHDIFNPLYGSIDDMLYPRLELIPGVFNLWDNSDPRFYDNDGDKVADIDEIINQKIRNFGGTPPTISSANGQSVYFTSFPTLADAAASVSGGNASTNTQSVGYFVKPWVDSNFKAFCPTSVQYNSSNPFFQALRDVVGVDMEGIYVGVKAPETITVNGQTSVGPSDYVFLTETNLKKVWFYLKNGVPTAPTDSNVANVAVYFYYPLNPSAPFVKSSTQRIYQVKSAAELNNPSASSGSSSSTGAASSYPPHDRRLGCIPKF